MRRYSPSRRCAGCVAWCSGCRGRCAAQGASDGEVEEDGEGQVEIEKEEGEVRERRSCMKME